MQERSIHDWSDDYDRTTSQDYEQHYDLVVRPAASRSDGCDCGGGLPPPPPPRFLLPPPPADPAWATDGESLCDILAPLQTCQAARTGVSAGSDMHPAPSMSMLAALITTSLFLFIVLVAGTIFFCKHRRKLSGLMSGKEAAKRGEASVALYEDLSRRRPHVIPTSLRSAGPHIEMVAVKGGRGPPHLLPGVPAGRGSLYFYPPAPSLTDDGSERLSNMYEEIPYYGHPAPSVSCCTDSDDDVISHMSEAEPSQAGVAAVPVAAAAGGAREPRYVWSAPPGAATASRRRTARRPPPQPALRRKDPYYYSDILARDESSDIRDGGDDGGGDGRDGDAGDGRDGGDAVPYGSPCDERRTPASLAYRLAADPLSDPLYGSRTGGARGRHKLSSFRTAPPTAVATDSDVYVNSMHRPAVVGCAVGGGGGYAVGGGDGGPEH